MKKDGCPYCQQGEFLAKFGVLAFETETSEVIVFKDQTNKGRAIVAYKKDHVAEIKDLSDAERNAFMKDVADVAKAIDKAYICQNVERDGRKFVSKFLEKHRLETFSQFLFSNSN